MCVDSYLRVIVSDYSRTFCEKLRIKYGRVGFGVGFCEYRYIVQKEESLKLVGVPGFFLELLARFELATSSLPRMRSTG